mgnify:CR=1 FL=1
MYDVKVIEHSVSPHGIELLTMQLTYPRYIHAEFMTHRVFSRNASSSRAIPTSKLIKNSLRDMVYPIAWGQNQAGMQAQDTELSDQDCIKAKEIWEDMANYCAKGVGQLALLGDINPDTGKPYGLHKQWANRPLEWFGNITVVVTSTDWNNWDELRNHEMAQPEIHHLAELRLDCVTKSVPTELFFGDWHLPYVSELEKRENDIEVLKMISTARCARVSYLTQEGKTPNILDDIKLYERLVGSVPLHASPCEHQATPNILNPNEYSGNFRGWIQHRKQLEAKFK